MFSDISMMLRKLILCFFVMYALSIKGQGSSICTVIDAETGEPLSFVQIYIADGRGALTNDEGRFSIEAHPSEVLIITCMGYQRMRIKAGNLPRVLKLTPSVTELKEVTVYSPQNILQQVINGMERDYNVYKKVSASYYMRQTYTMSGAMQMAEAYLQAACANNLRNVEFVAGRMFHGMNGGRKLSLDLSNIHATLSLAPMIKGESFWRGAVVPLNRKTFHKRYNYEKEFRTTITTQNDVDGRRIMCIHFAPAKDGTLHHTIMTGDLYVDADSLYPIGFQGRLDSIKLQANLDGEDSKGKASIQINIAYARTHGYNKVVAISTRLMFEDIDCRTIAYNVDNFDVSKDMQTSRSDNLLVAIWNTRKDADWWHRNFIMPTEVERRLMQGNGILLE